MNGGSDDTARVEALAALLPELGLFGLIERVTAEPDAILAAVLFGKLARHFYRSELGISLALWQASVQHCLSESRRSPDRDGLRKKAMAGSFNLGANAWPGWGEHAIPDVHLALGREAALLNLRLSRELAQGPLAESKSHWLIGAHRLAIADYAGAIEHFSEAKALARTASDAENELMLDGYIALTRVLSLPGESHSRESLSAVLSALRGDGALKHGAFFADQLETALKVFGGDLG